MAMSGGMPQASSQPSPDDHPSQQRPHIAQKTDLSKDELAVLKECSTESFWYRCVPLSVALIGLTQYSVKRGYLSPHPRYGALFKNMGASFLGYVLGKFSYQAKCRKKILALPDSRLGDAMRQRMGMPIMEEMTTAEPPSVPLGRESALKDEFRGLDIYHDNQSRPPLPGLDDSQRPTIDTGKTYVSTKEGQTEESTVYSSYDDLRKRNRDEHDKKRPAFSAGDLRHDRPTQDQRWSQSPLGGLPSPGSPEPPPSPPPPPRRPATGKAVNKYGDVWDE